MVMIQGNSGLSSGRYAVHFSDRHAKTSATLCSPASLSPSGRIHGSTSSWPSFRFSSFSKVPHMNPPKRHLQTVTPSAQTSRAGVISAAVQSSGPAKGKVRPGRDCRLRGECASPKSMSLRRSLRQRMRLAGLKSQWTMLCLWRKRSPFADCSSISSNWYIETECFLRQCCRERFYSHIVNRQFSC